MIQNNLIVASEYSILKADDAIDITQAHIIVPLGVFLQHRAGLLQRQDTGVWVDADEDIESLAGCTDQLSIIALNFPNYTDGRAYSSANILRREMNFVGEIRAIGDVRRDQLEQMMRCGFDAFQMAEGQDLQAALEGLKGFTFNYQSSIDRPVPLFRQR